MALRATSGPELSTRSVKVGASVELRAKVENTSGAEETVSASAEGLKEGVIVFAPPSLPVPSRSRKPLAFSWTATLPDGRDALTYRGRIVLRRVGDGALVGEAPLDIYVAK